MRKLMERIFAGSYNANRKTRIAIERKLPSAVAVDVYNVYEWAIQEGKLWYDYIDLMPHRLPFPEMWFEWNDHDHCQSGMLMWEEIRNDYVAIVGSPIIFVDDPALTTALGYGEFLGDFTDFKMYGDTITPIEFTEQQLGRMGGAALNVIVPSLVFFSCKNVELRRMEPSMKKERKLARVGVKAPAFHVIEIHKQTVRNVYEGGISKSTAVRHASMVRGHFKNYEGESKLFGKIQGKWFWQSHVRGDIGTPTVHDYRVWEPRHKGGCRVS